MERKVGTISRGIRCPIIREGDNLVDITVNSVLEACESENFSLRNKDVVALTESIVARAQGNYATVDDIAARSLNVSGFKFLKGTDMEAFFNAVRSSSVSRIFTCVLR